MRGLIELDYMLQKEAEENKKEDLSMEEIKASLNSVYSLLDKISLQIAEKEQEKVIEQVEENNENTEIKEEIVNEN